MTQVSAAFAFSKITVPVPPSGSGTTLHANVFVPPPAAVAVSLMRASASGSDAGLDAGRTKVTSGSSMIGKPGIGVHTRFTPVAVCWSENAP